MRFKLNLVSRQASRAAFNSSVLNKNEWRWGRDSNTLGHCIYCTLRGSVWKVRRLKSKEESAASLCWMGKLSKVRQWWWHLWSITFLLLPPELSGGQMSRQEIVTSSPGRLASMLKWKDVNVLFQHCLITLNESSSFYCKMTEFYE